MDRYKNREEAGERLAIALSEYCDRQDVIVLGLPRGGVPVAAPIARALKAPLHVFIVRKVGVPGHRELAMGAIGSGGVRVVNQSIMHSMAISDKEFEKIAAAEVQELKAREKAYGSGQLDLDFAGQTVILVDDGIATGATIRVAIKAIRMHQPRQLIVAVPVAPPDICEDLAGEVDDLVCPLQPLNFSAVSRWYVDFNQTADAEVRELLQSHRRGSPAVK